MVRIRPELTEEEAAELLKELDSVPDFELTYEEMINTIAEEGLDVGTDFCINNRGGGPGSVRLIKEDDGSYTVFTVGDRGIEYKRNFTKAEKAFGDTVSILRGYKERMRDSETNSFNRHV